MKDLALLVADKDMDYALRGILGRHQALRMRPVSHEIKVHSKHDAGVRTSGPETLALLQKEFAYGILMLDWEGSGTDLAKPEKLEDELNERLDRSGWDGRAKAIVIHPELDVWIWGSDQVLREMIG